MLAKIMECELILQNTGSNFKMQAKITKRELKLQNAS